MNIKQSNPLISILLIITALVVLAGCSPVYEIHYKYHPPTDQAGRYCIEKCQTTRTVCTGKCDAKELLCLEDAPALAEAMLQPREKQYIHNLEAYIADKEKYELKLERWRSERDHLQGQYNLLREQCKLYPQDRSYCSDKKKKSKALTRHDWRKPGNTPEAPDKPSYATELKLQQEKCEDDCSCNTRYDGCYSSCGGQVEPIKICVENCD